MSKALSALVTWGMSVREAASHFGVPKSTLGDRVSGGVQSGAISGPTTYLMADKETELVWFLVRCSKIGYPKSRKQVLALVRRLMLKNGIAALVTDGWWEKFCSRHSNLMLRALPNFLKPVPRLQIQL